MERRAKIVLATIAVPAFTIGTDFTGALMLLIPIEQEFRVDVTTTQWMLNIYALTFSMGMVTAGRLADTFGRRRLLVAGLSVFVVGSVACSVAPSIGALIGARAVQGIGSSIVWPCILGIASVSVRDDERGFAMGLVLGAVTTGNVLGPLIGGVVGALGEWRLFYGANVVLGVISLILVLREIPPEPATDRDEKIDLAGNAVLAIALLSLLYALDVGADWGWRSMGVVTLLALSVALFVAFPFVEDRVADPLIPAPMMRNRQFLLALSANGLVVPAVFLLFVYLPQYLHKVLGWPVLWASVGTLPLMASLAVTSVVSGRFYNRFGARRLVTFGYALTVLGAVATIAVVPAWDYVGLMPAMLLTGVGGAVVIGTAGAAAVGAADPSRASLAGALSFVFHLAFGAIGVATGTAILFAASASHLAQRLTDMGVSMSAANQATLNAAASGAEASREVLAAFPVHTAEDIVTATNDAFVAGLHTAYWFVLALTVIGIVVALCLRDEKLANVDK